MEYLFDNAIAFLVNLTYCLNHSLFLPVGNPFRHFGDQQSDIFLSILFTTSKRFLSMFAGTGAVIIVYAYMAPLVPKILDSHYG